MMMNLFKKVKGKNKLLKLYRAASQKQAGAFDTKSFLELILSEFDKWKIKLNNFHVTGPYPNEGWKTKNGFLNGLKKRNYKNIHHLMVSDSEGKFFLSFQNWSHNRTIEVDSDSIVLEVMFDENSVSDEELILFSQYLYPFLKFEYGYIIEQSKQFSIAERKINKGLFGYSESQNLKFDKWTTYNSATKSGYLRSIYQINFLSKQHLENESLKNTFNSIGKLECKGEYYLWTLSIPEVEKTLHLLKNSAFLVENIEFNKTNVCNYINKEIDKYSPKSNINTKLEI